jgi:predicted N-acetyltransferase YhbS
MPLPHLAPERPEDRAAVDALIDRAFGPGRYAKTAERLREGRDPASDLSIVASYDGAVVGCVRLWPIQIGDRPALLLGPFAVEAEHRRGGLGAALIERACRVAADAGHALILLVGDAAYFGPLDFSPVPARAVSLPGPVDQRRVLARALRPGGDEGLCGAVTAVAV